MKPNKTNTPFRFPFDINTKIFIGIAIICFILSFDAIRIRLTPQHTLTKYKSKLEQYIQYNIGIFKSTVRDTNLISQITENRINEEEINQIEKYPFSVFLYDTDSLLFWSSNDLLPEISLLKDNYITPLSHKKGKYIQFAEKVAYKTKVYTAVCVLKLKNENPYNSENFKNNFIPGDSENDFGMQLSVSELMESLPVNYQGTPIYYIYKKDDYFNVNDLSGWRLFLNSLPFIFFGISIHTYFKVEVKRKKPWIIFTALLIFALGIRSLSYFFGIPTDFSVFSLFDSKYFATDFINKSIGDTFVNMCLIFWIVLFYVVNVQGKVFQIKRKSPTIKIPFCLGVMAFLIISTTYFSNLIFEIINDSIINFDTTIFNQLNIFSVLGVLTFMVIFANFFILVIIANNYLNDCFKISYIKYILLIASYLIFQVFYKQPYPVCYYYAFLSIAGIMFLLDQHTFKLKFDFNSYTLLLWMIIISIAGAMILTKLINEKEISNRGVYASKLFNVEDKQIEDKLQELSEIISSDSQLVEMILTQEGNTHSSLKTYLERNFIENKFVKYKLDLHFFNQQNQNLNPVDPYQTMTKELFKNSGFFISENPFSLLRVIKTNREKGYEAFIPLYKKGVEVAYILLELKRNIFTVKNDYSDFIYQDDMMKKANDYNYSVGIYENRVIAHKSGSFEFPSVLKNTDIPKPGKGLVREKNGFSALYYNDDLNSKFVIVARQSNTLYLFTTLFAYIFLVYFITMTTYILGNIIARSNLNYTRFVNLLNINLRLRIHLAIIFLSLISFTAIGITISNFIIDRMVDKNRNQIINYSQSLQEDIMRYLTKNGVDNVNKLYEIFQKPEHNAEFINLAEKFKTNINLFNPLNGNLIFSSDNNIINNGLLAPKLNPYAFNRMNHDNKSQFVNSENIGNLNYLSAYSFISTQNRSNLAILQIPYISANTEIKSETSTIIITLINIFVLVFLLSSAFALFLTNSVTQPFRYIVKQFTKINLSKTNEPLQWQYSDEIGLLVKEYNRMLRKLENSTVLLAKTEREMAWREMAKQVAHEIKNPLTPMKLSLQMLERAIKNNNPNIDEITARVTNTLIEQIDNLTLIATNFSNFAKMPEMKKEYFNLNDVLYAVTGMYNDDQENEFLFLIPDYNIIILADKSQLIRVFTNIIQNAIQSIPSTRKGNIALQVTKVVNNNIRVTISDNGEGIDKQKAEKLFQPYFTTKSSGTGLGLAMCKDILEQFGGRIWFESKLNEGSSFHIELPTVTELLDEIIE